MLPTPGWVVANGQKAEGAVRRTGGSRPLHGSPEEICIDGRVAAVAGLHPAGVVGPTDMKADKGERAERGGLQSAKIRLCLCRNASNMYILYCTCFKNNFVTVLQNLSKMSK